MNFLNDPAIYYTQETHLTFKGTQTEKKNLKGGERFSMQMKTKTEQEYYTYQIRETLNRKQFFKKDKKGII